ncbi:Ig-like domain-containing protein [Epilithonimonas sp.]|uniref:Ig-like domain-containing protein n=1 Tax=Epilithonimonas sp. TaxID=2894511 RepID=UPI00289D286A|nr:Ig-like domain-containing protein [Epilithonimonas sp.]
MKKNLYVVFAMLIANIFYAQIDLVKWDLTSDGSVSYSDSRITATSIAHTDNPISYDNRGMVIRGWNNGGIEHYRYLGFSVNSSNGSSVKISNLVFEQEKLNPGPDNYTIRYYISQNGTETSDWDFFYKVNSTILIDNESIANNPIKNIPLNITLSGSQRLIIKFYSTGNDWNAGWRIKANTLKLTEVQAIAPVANNDSFTAYKNNDANFDILANDSSSSAINSITITQQPSHGTLIVNGTTDVTYKPATGYLGEDSFKYKSQNSTGLSNEATVSINVVNNVNAVLARWNNTNYTPSRYNDKIDVTNLTATNVSLAYDENVGVNGGAYNAFNTGGWPDKNTQTIDKTKYIQLTISPKNGYKLYLSEFNFLCAMQGGDANIQIDYSLSKDFKTYFNVLPETYINSGLNKIKLTDFTRPIATDGQVVYLRIYVYNTWNAMQVLLKKGQDLGPAFIGTIESSSTTPIAYNDDVTNTVNDDIDINVLINDDYSNKLDSLVYSQPSHGIVSINADRTINYLPRKDFVGTDTFTYYLVNEYGTSNSATVTINVVANSTNPLIRWDNTDFTATPFKAFIAKTKMTSTDGMTIHVGNETNPKTFYVESNDNTNAINTDRYIQFIFENNGATKAIEPKTFNYTAKGTNGAKYELRYSRTDDFSSYEVLGTGNVDADYTPQEFKFKDGLVVLPSQKVFIRLYFYNTYYMQYVFHFLPGGSGPEIRGQFYNKTYAPDTETIWQDITNPYWSNGEPNATKNVTINAPYNTKANGSFESKNLTINSEASLIVNTGDYITVYGKIENKATASDFIIENDANLLQKNDFQNVGDVTVKKLALLPKMGYNYWSSPVSGQNLYNFSEGYNQANGGTGTGTPWNRFYVYDEKTDYFKTSIANEITLNAESPFEDARGYAIRGKNSFDAAITDSTKASQFKFVGVPHNGNIPSYPLKYTDAKHGYNMIGNPYPSNIDFDMFYELNKTKIKYLAYFWTNNDGKFLTQQGSNYGGNNYVTINGGGAVSATYIGNTSKRSTGSISVGQGFIVQAIETGKNQTLSFNNSLRTYDTANYYNKTNTPKNRFWLEFKSPTDVNNEILIGYIAKATNGFDTNYDADLLSIGSDSFWSVLDENKLSIQSKAPDFTQDDIVKIGYKASVSGDYTISLTEKEGIFSTTQTVYLKDKYLNKVINITENPYSFSTTAGTYDDRFEVVYKPSETLGTDNVVKKGIQIYKDSQNFIVKSDENLVEVSLYDALGRLLFNTKNAKNEVFINKTILAEGMYIVKAYSRNTMLTKKVLK